MIYFIKKISDFFAYVSRWLLILLIIIIFYDVFMRYVLNMPTLWAYDSSYFLGAFLVTFEFASFKLSNGNVRVDIIYNHFNRKTQLFIDLFMNILIICPAFILFTWEWYVNTYTSLITQELITQSMFHPLFWPIKALLTIGYTIFVLALYAQIILDIRELISLNKYNEE